MSAINASNDRVVIHQAMKHLIVAGNSLIFMGKDGLKNFPLNRYVLERDGNGNVIEIVTKELINRKLVDVSRTQTKRSQCWRWFEWKDRRRHYG